MLRDSSAATKSGLLLLSGDALKTRLQQLSPELTDAETFASIVDELKSSALPQYAGLADLSHETIDCCGTGGSGKDRFNTSTVVAFVLAAGGLRVAKFGNRAVSGKSGSFDFLTAIGFTGTLSASHAADMLEKHGMTFLYAPDVYPQLASLSAMRKSLGCSTVLNFTGPLLNPANPRYRLMGVSAARMQELIASALSCNQPQSRAFIVRSLCGLDELCAGCQSSLIEVKDGGISRRTVCALTASLPAAKSGLLCQAAEPPALLEAAVESAAANNARRFFDIIEGADTSSAAYQLVVLNGAAGFQLRQSSADLPDLILEVKQLISSGELKRTYLRLRMAYESYTD